MNTEPDENAAALHHHLAMLGWSQAMLADWITEQGHPVPPRTVERWLAEGGTRCPGWPIAMLRLAGLTENTQ